MNKKKYIILTIAITAIATVGIVLGVQYFSEHIVGERLFDGNEKTITYAVFTEPQNDKAYISEEEILRLSDLLANIRTQGRVYDYEERAGETKTDFKIGFDDGSTMNFGLWENGICFINGTAYKINASKEVYEDYSEFTRELSENYF